METLDGYSYVDDYNVIMFTIGNNNTLNETICSMTKLSHGLVSTAAAILTLIINHLTRGHLYFAFSARFNFMGRMGV